MIKITDKGVTVFKRKGDLLLTYGKRLTILITIDTVIALFSIFIGHLILLPVNNVFTSMLIVSAIVLVLAHHVFAYWFKLYKRLWQYASMDELLAILKAVTLSIIVTGIAQVTIFEMMTTRTLMITWMLHIHFIGGSRFVWRLYRDTYINPRYDQMRTLIIGAGSAGTMVARQLQQNPDSELKPVAFIDDDKTKQKLEIHGLPVCGGIEKIEETVEKLRIEHIIIAIPSLTKSELRKIFEECQKTEAKTKIMPLLEDIVSGRLEVNDMRDVEVEDLLGRDPVELDTENISNYIESKTILVTGAGGSIGSEVCRQICKFHPSEIILLGHGENSIYTIEMELKNQYKHTIIHTEIADIKDRKKIVDVMNKYCPDVVYHAAAHKHVPLMERNPEEAVKNNVIGTKNVAEASAAAKVDTFVMISTDKAVNPTSVMGATKRMAEMIVQHMNMVSTTRFVAVRFGNVLGSRGSVIPLFKKQIKAGGPVTVTHPDMTRYFMTIPEASRLVIQAGALAKGGEIFVLDMGEPVKIVSLAKNLIRLSGYTEKEIGITFTGMRPGEKLYEELLEEGEVQPKQVYPKIYIGKSMNIDYRIVEELIHQFENYTPDTLRKKLLEIGNLRKKDTNLTAVVD